MEKEILAGLAVHAFVVLAIKGEDVVEYKFADTMAEAEVVSDSYNASGFDTDVWSAPLVN